MDLESFYEMVPERRASREIQLGTAWKSQEDPASLSMVFWIEITGELCVLTSPPTDVRLGGTLKPYGIYTPSLARSSQPAHVEIISVIDSEVALLEMLEGWEEAMKGEEGLDWLYEVAGTGSAEPS